MHAPTYTAWGKADLSGPVLRLHPLRDHAMDVACTFRALTNLAWVRKAIASTTPDELVDAHFDRLSVIALLHDVGKCNRGFQAKCDPAATRTAGHVAEAAAFLWNSEIRSLWSPAWKAFLVEASDWFARGEDEPLAQMLLAAISHHGRPVTADDAFRDSNPVRWWRASEDMAPLAAVDDLVAVARAAFPAAFDRSIPPITATAALQQRFAGLVMLADWIGSDTSYFPYRRDAAEDRKVLASESASRALSQIGLVPPVHREARPFGEVFPGCEPTPLQNFLANELPIDDASRLVLVESDTGSGKTEAALAWFLRLYRHGLVDAMYFALPTRVAARELFSRVQRAMERAFPSPGARPSPILLAAPGYVRVAVAERALPAPDGRLWEDDPVERLRERVWAAAHPKRFLAAPIAVGTIDQALLSGLQVKHSMMRSVCLDRSLLVVDEVHASDPYMRELLAAVLERHRARGGHALLLSATLGDVAGARYFRRSLFTLHESASRPYPSVTTLAGEAPIDRTPSAKTVDVEVVESFDNEPIVPRIVRALRDGARVLAICNTVARANALLRAVETNADTPKSALFAVNGSVCPHHGRFARDHREVMDAAVTARLGKGTLDGPVLLVGTQTLEQSLDIDADWLVTDLCPMDVLLQRIGRLHRHVRPTRPREFTTARVLLRGPPGGDLAPSLGADGALRAPAGLGIVYPDGRVLQRTLDLVRERARLTLPRDNRELVEQTTHPDALATLPASWMRHGREFVEGREMAQVRAAVANSLDDQVPFGELVYPAPDESIGTRLGAATIELPLREPVDRVFGVAAHAIGLAAHLLPRGVVLPEALEPEPLDDGFAFSLGTRRFRYTRYGLEVDDDA